MKMVRKMMKIMLVLVVRVGRVGLVLATIIQMRIMEMLATIIQMRIMEKLVLATVKMRVVRVGLVPVLTYVTFGRKKRIC